MEEDAKPAVQAGVGSEAGEHPVQGVHLQPQVCAPLFSPVFRGIRL